MSSPDNNPFKPAEPPQFAPVEVVEVVAEQQRQFDAGAAAALSRSWPYAGTAGLILLAIAAAVSFALYTNSPFRHVLVKVGTTAVLGGALAVPAMAILMFAGSAWKLRGTQDQEQFVLAAARQRRAITSAGIGFLILLAIAFLLLMMQLHSFIDRAM